MSCEVRPKPFCDLPYILCPAHLCRNHCIIELNINLQILEQTIILVLNVKNWDLKNFSCVGQRDYD